ncbi:hypothetical protein EJ07DRAFT_155676 [Lizonia empirigonia]|nr:hypothetical protein EJ07DRAFT_155676 [Lizonia empirigonia]
MLRPTLTLGFLLLAALFTTTSASRHKPNCGNCVTKNSGCLSVSHPLSHLPTPSPYPSCTVTAPPPAQPPAIACFPTPTRSAARSADTTARDIRQRLVVLERQEGL